MNPWNKLFLCLAAVGCNHSDPAAVLATDADLPFSDIAHVHLDLNLERQLATATLTFDSPNESGPLIVSVAGLSHLSVNNVEGRPLSWRREGDRLLVWPLVAPPAVVQISVGYRFEHWPQSDFAGLLPKPDEKGGATLLWPHECGRLYPCNPHTSDGMTFSMNVSGTPIGLRAVYPAAIGEFGGDGGPSYMIGIAYGDYEYVHVGSTSNETEVGAYVFRHKGSIKRARLATQGLVAAFDWFEQSLGQYRYGPKVASVEVDWGEGDFGGIEQHPLWHITKKSFHRSIVHIHEAAHGWYGVGVRPQCNEDLVLSEGVASYLTARAIEVTQGRGAALEVWRAYLQRLHRAPEIVVLPDHGDACNQISSMRDVFNNATYMRGAFFMRSIENSIGAEALDGVLSEFYAQYGGKAARMSDLIEFVDASTGFDARALAESWLRVAQVPQEPCRMVPGLCM